VARKNLKKQKNSSIKQEQGRRVATNAQKFKAGLTDSFMILMPIMYIVFYFVMDGEMDLHNINLMDGFISSCR